MVNVNTTKRLFLSVVILLALGIGTSGCQSSESEKPESRAQAAPADTPPEPVENPAWISARESWPDTMRLTLDTEDEVYQDDLRLRLTGDVFLDIRMTDFPNNKPIICEFLLTIYPIPQWENAKGLVMDSVVFYDTVNKRRLPPLPMLSVRRGYENQAVRTVFTPDLADPVEPELTEGQMLDPSVYFTWDGRTLIIDANPIPVTILKRGNM